MTICFEPLSLWSRIYMAIAEKLADRSSSGSDSEVDLHRADRLFDDILHNHKSMIERICFGYANSRAEMQDLYQDVMLNIWKALPRFRGDSSLKTWTYRVTLNTCVSTFRSQRRRWTDVEIETLIDTPDNDNERREQIVELYRIIATLSTLDKAIVMMWLDELSYDEIAKTVGIPRNTVATRLHRAKQQIGLRFRV